MPCMGPDLTWAKKHGQEIGEKLFADIIEKHHLIDPTIEDGMFKLPDAEKRWKRIKKQFVKAVGEMFVEDACNGF